MTAHEGGTVVEIHPDALAKVRAWTRRRVQDWEDYVQDGCVRVLEHPDSPLHATKEGQVTLLMRGVIDSLRQRRGRPDHPLGRWLETQAVRMLSLDALQGTGGRHPGGWHDETPYPRENMRREVAAWMATQPPRTQAILWAWAAEVPFRTIAEQQGLTIARVSQIMTQALPGWRALHTFHGRPGGGGPARTAAGTARRRAGMQRANQRRYARLREELAWLSR